MKIFSVGGIVFLTALTLASRAAEPAEKPDAALAPWLADFHRYAAQKETRVGPDSPRPSPPATRLQLSDLLRTLPDPTRWPQLRSALAAATSRIPNEQTLEKSRLRAGTWLLTYLLGDKQAVEKELAGLIPAAPARPDSEQSARTAWALEQLHESMTQRSGPSAEQQLKEFETQLKELEPVDVAEVKAVLGSEENFKRLTHVIEQSREMQKRLAQISADYERTKDQAAAEAKAEALEKEFAEKYADDRKALEPFGENDVLRRYFADLYRKENPSEITTPTLEVPDLVPSAGRERAEILLRHALHLGARLELNHTLDAATRQLLRQLVRSEIETIKAPLWSLVHDSESQDLFEAFQRRFPAADQKDYAYREARGYYLATLIREGHTSEAAKLAADATTNSADNSSVDLPYEMLDQLERNNPEQLWNFFAAWLSQNPAASYWNRFTLLSVKLERQSELKALIKTMTADDRFKGLNRIEAQRLQAGVELATGEIAAAEARLRALVELPAADQKERKVLMTLALTLLELSDLQSDSTGFTKALARAEALVEKDWDEKIDEPLSQAANLTEALNRLGRYADGARIGRTALDRIAELEKNAAAEKDPEKARGHSSSYLSSQLLGEQLCAEVELGQWSAAVALLQENPNWDKSDVAQLLTTTAANRKPLGYYAALVAQHQGDVALARRILEALLVARPGVDVTYETYLGLTGKDALPLLEKLAASDRYEERPLIWKARLQLDAKENDAAIATLQQAIAIDPSDGEEGRGDRMRVYALMAQAMAAKGDATKAKLFEGVVKAIRLSEQADRWYEADAYSRAISLYREALGFFQDAYCIQSRLAIQLAHEGKMDEAVEHYRRAFELMPDSFGRVESHCFGCEHAFEGEKPQSLAEEVFARLLKARPDLPQLHYLSGYLRDIQGRTSEAAVFYRRAVELDPLYLNAWNKLASLEKIKSTPAEHDDLLLKLAELDPTSRHVSPNLEQVLDLPRLWRTLEANRRRLEELPAPGPLWVLKASAERLAKKKEDDDLFHDDTRRTDFASVLGNHPFIRALHEYVTALNMEPVPH